MPVRSMARRLAKTAFTVNSAVSVYDHLENALPARFRRPIVRVLTGVWVVGSSALAYVGALFLEIDWLVLLLVAAPVGLLNLLALRLLAARSADRKESIHVLFRGPMTDAVRQIGDLAMHVRNAIHGKGGLSGQAEHLLQVLESKLGSAYGAMAESIEVGPSRRELQEEFISCFRAYQDLINPIRDVGEEAGYNWTADGNYGLWKRCDEDFLRRLDELTIGSAFTDLRAQVTLHMWPAGGRRDYWA
jgi:hypothetical protein